MSDITFEDCIPAILWICVGIVIGTCLCYIDWAWLNKIDDYHAGVFVGFCAGAMFMRFLWLVKES